MHAPFDWNSSRTLIKTRIHGVANLRHESLSLSLSLSSLFIWEFEKSSIAVINLIKDPSRRRKGEIVIRSRGRGEIRLAEEHVVFHDGGREEKSSDREEEEEEEGSGWDREKANNRDEGFRASLPTFRPSAVRMLRVSYEKEKKKEKGKKRKEGKKG